MSTEPGDIKPQLPPASKPTLPPAPKLSLAGGTKPAFKPDAPAAPSAPAAPAAPTLMPGLAPAPTLRPVGAPSAAPVTVAASRAPVIQAQKASLSSIKAVDDSEVPTWHAALSGFSLVASLTAVVLLFLELKPTL